VSTAIYHLLRPGEWPQAGEYRPPSLTSEGFVHFSFADQVAASANRHFPDAAELLAVEVDPSAVAARVKVEDTYGTGTAYPHVYGPIPVAAAVGIHRLCRDAARRWVFNPAPAAPGHVAPDR
jgi:uncharacterized protein (DUF952 family)